MEGLSTTRLEQTGTNKSGYPVYERVRELHEDIGSPEFTELDKKGQGRLRLTIALVGGLAAGVGGYGYKLSQESSNETSPSVSESTYEVPDYTNVEPAETVEAEVELENEKLLQHIERYRSQYQLAFYEVQFLNAENQPVGEPVVIHEEEGEWPEDKPLPEGQEATYKYSPGPQNGIGLVTDGISGEWLDYQQKKLQAQFPDEPIGGRTHVTQEFLKVYGKAGLEEVTAKIDSGEIETYEDLLYHFSSQEIKGVPRYQYALDTVSFRNEDLVIPIEGGETVRRAVPSYVQERFRELAPGLIAHESRWRDDVVSPVGAKGAYQIMSAEWKRVTGDEEVSTSFVRQTEVWGEVISDMYDSVQDRIGEQKLDALRSKFPSEEAFQVELIVPLTINAYNAGPARVAEVVQKYLDSVQMDDMPEGKDLFLAIATFGELAKDETHAGKYLDGYSTEAKEYVSEVIATADAQKEFREKKGREARKRTN